MRSVQSFLVILACVPALSSSPALAWEAKASGVDSRIQELESAWVRETEALGSGKQPAPGSGRVADPRNTERYRVVTANGATPDYWGPAYDPGVVQKDKLARARQKRKPEWTSKTVWSEKRDGKEYVFGVGMVSGVPKPESALRFAEGRALASLLQMTGKTERQAAVNEATGAKSVRTVSQGSIPAKGLDWYLDGKSGSCYALVVSVR